MRYAVLVFVALAGCAPQQVMTMHELVGTTPLPVTGDVCAAMTMRFLAPQNCTVDGQKIDIQSIALTPVSCAVTGPIVITPPGQTDTDP